MKAYSQDLRERILAALQGGEAPQHAIAERFCVSLSFVEKLWRRFRRSGSGAAKPHAGGKRRALKDHTTFLRRAVETQPEATLEELREWIAAAQGPQVSTATICRELQRLKLPVKKVAPRGGAGYGACPDVADCLPGGGRGPRRPTPEV